MAAEEERVKRPPNAWILFRTYYGGTQPVYPDGTRIPQNQISTVASKIWNKFNEAQRRPWEEQADQAKVAHMAAHPNWRYRPRSKAIKEQQKLEERLAKAAAREEAKKAKQAAKRHASGAGNAGGVKRSPSRRLSPAMTVSPYPCVSPLPGISLANFGPSPPVSAASSPMVGPLALPAIAEQSPAATLVGTPDQRKYPLLMLDSHLTTTNNTNTTTSTPALLPTLTLNDANDTNNDNTTANTNDNTTAANTGAPADSASATENKDRLNLGLDFFATQFKAEGGLLPSDFGMDGGLGHMGGMNGIGSDATADWATPAAINNLGLMENSVCVFHAIGSVRGAHFAPPSSLPRALLSRLIWRDTPQSLSFPLDPGLFGDFTGWANTQMTENDDGPSSTAATPAADLSGSSNSNSANTTPDTSFELPFVFNMEGGFAFGLDGVDFTGGNGFDAGLDLHLNLNLNMDLGAVTAQPGGCNSNGYYQDPYAGVNNFGGFDFTSLDGDFGAAPIANEPEWANGMGLNVNFDAFADLDDAHSAQVDHYESQTRPKEEEGQEDVKPPTHKHEAPIATLVTAATPAAAAASCASPDTYASPSSYALQPVENLTETPHSSASSSAASTPYTQNAANGHGVYKPPKGAGNGNRRVAASFKAPPVPLRTASYTWVPSTGGGNS